MEKLPAVQILPEQDCDESSARETDVSRVLAVVGLWTSEADIILREHDSIIARDCATEREKDNAWYQNVKQGLKNATYAFYFWQDERSIVSKVT